MSLAKDLNIPEDTWEDVVVPPTDLWSMAVESVVRTTSGYL